MRLTLILSVLASYATASSLYNEVDSRERVAALTRDPNANIDELQEAVMNLILSGIPELSSDTDGSDECRLGVSETDGYAPNLTTDDVFSTESDPSMVMINAFISSLSRDVASTSSPLFTETKDIARGVENQVDSVSTTTEDA